MHGFWTAIAAVLVASGGVVIPTVGAVLWRKTARTGRDVKQVVEDFRGEPPRPGVDARPGVMEQLQAGREHFAAIDARIEELSGQVVTVQETLDREIPVNGKPLAEKIDLIYQHLIVNTAGADQ